jgi:hypothetical protein
MFTTQIRRIRPNTLDSDTRQRYVFLAEVRESGYSVTIQRGGSMRKSSLSDSGSQEACALAGATLKRSHRRTALLFLAMLVLFATRVVAQNSPHVATVAPDSGKVDDTITVTGANLGKDGVVAAFLSDDTMDYKAAITEQAADKIVMKVPEVKPGRYNVSIQVAGKIIISPLHFTVQ